MYLRKLCLVGLVLSSAACGNSPSQSRLDGNPSNSGDQSSMFPTMPDDSLTPGKLCSTPDTYRYPQHIPYCNRDVQSDLKREIIHTYDVTFNYHIEQMNRMDFKIDHYIPLCMGGANEEDNLWPQHKSVYTVTDPLEPKLCQLMADGKMSQDDAVAKIKYGKHHLNEVAGILQQLNQM